MWRRSCGRTSVRTVRSLMGVSSRGQSEWVTMAYEAMTMTGLAGHLAGQTRREDQVETRLGDISGTLCWQPWPNISSPSLTWLRRRGHGRVYCRPLGSRRRCPRSGWKRWSGRPLHSASTACTYPRGTSKPHERRWLTRSRGVGASARGSRGLLGSAMALAYDANRVMRDVDATFVPHGVVLEEA
jgi:hypothetical protein